jgi:hypothetical protein
MLETKFRTHIEPQEVGVKNDIIVVVAIIIIIIMKYTEFHLTACS